MKKGTILFKGNSTTNNNTYFLAIDENNTVYVFRNFKNDIEKSDKIPSGWDLDKVHESNILTIVKGWYVYPTLEAWEEIVELSKNN